jgi:ABC-2 type transport system permease protein
MDCNLLVVAGPRETIPDLELDKVELYLKQGGRLLALFNCYPILPPGKKDTGLEKVLAKWGVDVGHNVIKDPDNTSSGTDVIVGSFAKHPLVNSLLQSRLHLLLPRSVGRLKLHSQAADAPRVEELAFSGPGASAPGDLVHKPPFPLMVAVEKGALKDVITERGSTRILVVGDSLFLGNHQIDSLANRDFAGYAVNWLLERTQLLEGLGPRPVQEHRVVMTKTQLHQAQWVLLAGLPGSVLLLGGLVWLRRRK